MRRWGTKPHPELLGSFFGRFRYNNARRGSRSKGEAPPSAQVEHFGSPSLVAGAADVLPMKMAQVFMVKPCPTVAVHPSAVVAIVRPVTPVVVV